MPKTGYDVSAHVSGSKDACILCTQLYALTELYSQVQVLLETFFPVFSVYLTVSQ